MNLIPIAHSAGDSPQKSGGLEMVVMLVIFAAIFYFMVYRPQAKRVKEHKNLMSSISKGDEVLTSGGLIGKIKRISEKSDSVAIELNANNEVILKKDFITAVLPKGTLKYLYKL